MKKKSNRRAFTIVELVIVIAVIAVLAAALLPAFGNMIESANNSKLMQEAKNAYTQYLIDHAVDGDDTEFAIASITKMYTTTVILSLSILPCLASNT